MGHLWLPVSSMIRYFARIFNIFSDIRQPFELDAKAGQNVQLSVHFVPEVEALHKNPKTSPQITLMTLIYTDRNKSSPQRHGDTEKSKKEKLTADLRGRSRIHRGGAETRRRQGWDVDLPNQRMPEFLIADVEQALERLTTDSIYTDQKRF